MAGFDLTFEHDRADGGRVRQLVLLLLVVVFCLLANRAYAGPSGFTFCSGEGEPCNLSGVDAFVTYGSGDAACDIAAGTCTGTYSPLYRFDHVNFTCGLAQFGGVDPAPGVLKICYWISAGGTATPPPPPASTPAPSSGQSAFPWSLTAEDGLALSVAILGVWATAFAVRAAIRALGSDDQNGSSE